MQSKLSDLVDDFSEIDNKYCKTYMEGKMSNQNVSLLELKMLDYIISEKNVEKDVVIQKKKRINRKVSKDISILQR